MEDHIYKTDNAARLHPDDLAQIVELIGAKFTPAAPAQISETIRAEFAPIRALLEAQTIPAAAAQILANIDAKLAPMFAQVQAQSTPAAVNTSGDPLGQLGTLKRAAELLNMSYGTLANLAMKNQLPFRRLNKKSRTKLYIPREILEFTETNTAPPLAKKRGTVSRHRQQLEKVGV